VKSVDPNPIELAPRVTVIQGTMLTDVHAQFDPVMTGIVATVPFIGADKLVGETL